MPTGTPVPTGPKLGSAAVTGVQVRTRVVTDRQTQSFPGVEGNPAAGQAEVRLPAVPSGYGFEIERLDLWSNSTVGSSCSLYIGAPSQQNEIDYSLDANHDLGDFAQPIYVPSGSYLTLLWETLSAGAKVNVRAQWSVVQFVAVTYP